MIYNDKIGPDLGLSWNIMQRKYIKKKYVWNLFISYNFSIVSGGHFVFLQTKHEWGFET